MLLSPNRLRYLRVKVYSESTISTPTVCGKGVSSRWCSYPQTGYVRYAVRLRSQPLLAYMPETSRRFRSISSRTANLYSLWERCFIQVMLLSPNRLRYLRYAVRIRSLPLLAHMPETSRHFCSISSRTATLHSLWEKCFVQVMLLCSNRLRYLRYAVKVRSLPLLAHMPETSPRFCSISSRTANWHSLWERCFIQVMLLSPNRLRYLRYAVRIRSLPLLAHMPETSRHFRSISSRTATLHSLWEKCFVQVMLLSSNRLRYLRYAVRVRSLPLLAHMPETSPRFRSISSRTANWHSLWERCFIQVMLLSPNRLRYLRYAVRIRSLPLLAYMPETSRCFRSISSRTATLHSLWERCFVQVMLLSSNRLRYLRYAVKVRSLPLLAHMPETSPRFRSISSRTANWHSLWEDVLAFQAERLTDIVCGKVFHPGDATVPE